MKTRLLVIVYFLSMGVVLHAQWNVGAGVGLSLPITGYGKVVEPGMTVFNLDGNHSLGKGHLAVGMKIQMSRFSEDANPDDAYYEAKLTVAPVLFTLDYIMLTEGKLQPYLTGGLGLSFFVVSYNSSPTVIDDQSIFNVSFTMMPVAGLKYKANDHLYPFLETGGVFIMDGPPVGFPEGYNVTGYQFISAGIKYRLD